MPLTLLALVMLPMSAFPQDFSVPLPPGETPLAHIGIYRVAYQSYGGQTVEMPVSWTGHFEPVSGISYTPGEILLGRSAILLHSPWRVPPGKVWVDYRLQLPDITPIRLSFGIAMHPDMMVPGRSDGVTFSCYLLADAQQELLRRHWDKAQWLDYAFDLSAHAGKEVTLRLQTEPGPNNDPGWDYSYFGDAKITVGDRESGRTALLDRLTSTKAYRATETADLRPLCNDPRHGITPGNLLPHRNAILRTEAGYQFTYEADDCHLTYTYQPQTGTLDDFTVQVDDQQPFWPSLGGAVTALLDNGPQPKTAVARGGKPASITLDNTVPSLTVVWNYDLEGLPLQVTWTFGIIGKALTISASCDTPVVTGFSLGNVGGAPLRRSIAVPYLPADWGRGTVTYLPAHQLYVCRYLDWTRSHSSRCPQGEAYYEPKTDGSRNPMREVGYIAVSPHVGEVLPNAPHPPSPYLAVLGPRIMLDVWGHHEGTYQGDAQNLRDLKDNGVDHMAIIQHVWQRYGYDVKLPDHIPANPDFGGEEGMIAFGQAANQCGYLWALHENYIDLYPDAPSYDPTARVLRADGSPSPAWYNAGTGVQSFGLKCNRALDYARQNSPEAHRRYGTTAAYLDVHTCVPPWHQLDHEAGQPMAAMALAKVRYDSELFQYERDTHGGPLFGEGANHFYWAGKVDGVEAQVAGGEHHVPFLDFDLLKLHPQMVNHGMGYYERWFAAGYNHRFGLDTGTLEQIDKYRAQELAYGHAGFVGAAQVDNIQWVAKEHHMMHPAQRLYGAAKPSEIRYEVAGRFVTASLALALNSTWRQRIRYDSGLTLWVNWAPEPWEVQGRTLPQWGFLALGPDTQVYTVLRNGHFVDYAECPEYVFADARTFFHMPYLQSSKEIEPRLRDFAYLGDNRIRVTYEWLINDTLDQDYTCFVHFINEQQAGAEQIVFQQDHPLPTPTSQWQPGQTLVDGPYDITVPATYDTYDIVIGLYKGPRVPLKGIETSGGRILIGRLRLTREGDRITNIELDHMQDAATAHQIRRADFTVRLNPPGTLVDFGKLATDGSVKVNRLPDRLIIFPYPRNRAFRVILDPKALVPGANVDLATVRVRALAARTQQDMGQIPHQIQDGRIAFSVGLPGAGRYVLMW